MSRTQLTVAVGVLVALLAVSIGGVAADDVTAIDNSHDLDSDWATDRYADEGYVEGDVDIYDMQLTVAEDREDVADTPLITDTSDWVRIEYNEEVERTLRITLPKDYGQPYERAGVESITSDHDVDLEPVKDGEFLQLTVEVDGPTEIVIPLEWDGQLSYTILDRVSDRVDRLQEWNPLSADADWQYIESGDLEGDNAMTIADHDDVLVEVDARPNQPDDRWVPAPRSNADQPVYWYTQDGNNGTEAIVVSTTDDAPNIRYAEDHDLIDQIWSEVGSAREIPNNIMDSLELPDWLPGVGS